MPGTLEYPVIYEMLRKIPEERRDDRHNLTITRSFYTL
jgi:hypothetical protein